MNIVKCNKCDKTEEVANAEQSGWIISAPLYPNSDREGIWTGICPKCMQPNKTARNLEELVDVWGKPDANYTTVTFGKFYNSTVDKVPQTYYDWAVRTLAEKNGNNRTRTNPQRESVPDPIRTSPKKETSQQPLESTYNETDAFPQELMNSVLKMQKKVEEQKKKMKEK